MAQRYWVMIALTLATGMVAPVLGQTTQPPKADPLAVKKLEAGWEEMDSRMVFLTMQLSSVEASLAAVNKAILLTGYRKETQKVAIDQYDRGNELMDRKAGGPVPWSEFYGRTAEKFFYHPQENEISLSVRVLRQQGQAIDKPGEVVREQTQPSNRPPQFDYIYRANVQAKAKAEADIAALGNKVETLLERRRQLEAEQSTLWAQIVTRSVACRSLNEKPWYRLQLSTADAGAAEKLKAAQAAAKFLRTELAILDKTEEAKRLNDDAVYRDLEKITGTARIELMDALYAQRTLQADVADIQKPVGRFFALAKRTHDLTKNINDAYQVAVESDKAGDDLRKGTSRGLLQTSLVNYAETILALDEVFGVMVQEWNIEAVPGKPAEKIELKVSDFSKAAPPAADENKPISSSRITAKTNNEATAIVTPAPREVNTNSVTAKINAASLWTNVNFRVTRGKIYEVNALGRWSGSTGGTVGPNGFCPPNVVGSLGPAEPNKDKLKKTVFYEKHPRSALIARFDSKDWTFYVGSKLRFIAPVDDTLSFRINDTDLDSVARQGVVTITIAETTAQSISAANGFSVFAWIDANDFLHVTSKGVFWEYGGEWSRVGEHEGVYPTIVNGIMWWPAWKDAKISELLPIEDIGALSSTVIRIQSDHSVRGGVKFERQNSEESVFRFNDGGLGASIVAADFIVRN